MAQYIDQISFELPVDQLEEELNSFLPPVRPDPEFINRLGQRLKRPTVITLEKRSLMGAYLIVAFGLFGGVLLAWIIGTVSGVFKRLARI